MSCVILIVSIVPCKDAAAFNEKQSAVVVKAAANHDCSGNSDVCSPLCICNCCAGCTLYYSYPQLSKFVIHLSVQHSDFIKVNIHKIVLPIWQPPQL